MFKESWQNNVEKINDSKAGSKELSDLTIDDVFEKLGIKEPNPEEITNLASYMEVQREVMQALIDKFHDEETAITLFQEKLSKEFAERYRHGF